WNSFQPVVCFFVELYGLFSVLRAISSRLCGLRSSVLNRTRTQRTCGFGMLRRTFSWLRLRRRVFFCVRPVHEALSAWPISISARDRNICVLSQKTRAQQNLRNRARPTPPACSLPRESGACRLCSAVPQLRQK